MVTAQRFDGDLGAMASLPGDPIQFPAQPSMLLLQMVETLRLRPHREWVYVLEQRSRRSQQLTSCCRTHLARASRSTLTVSEGRSHGGSGAARLRHPPWRVRLISTSQRALPLVRLCSRNSPASTGSLGGIRSTAPLQIGQAPLQLVKCLYSTSRSTSISTSHSRVAQTGKVTAAEGLLAQSVRTP
jgi:hypothetical protein